MERLRLVVWLWLVLCWPLDVSETLEPVVVNDEKLVALLWLVSSVDDLLELMT